MAFFGIFQKAYGTTGVPYVQLQGKLDIVADGYISAGTSAAPVALTTGKNMVGLWASSSATTGDERVVYASLKLTGAAGSGESGRFYSKTTSAVTSMHGVHCTAEMQTGIAGAAIGLIAGGRFTLACATGVTGMTSGSLYGILIESAFTAAVTGSSSNAAICVRDIDGSNKFTYLLSIPNLGCAFASTTAAAACSYKIKIRINGVDAYIPCVASGATS